MKLVVPLMMPASHSIRLAVRPSRSALMIGMPPATAASKATMTLCSLAAAKISLPWTASSALLAVTTCLPWAIASSTRSRAMPVPPISSHDDVDRPDRARSRDGSSLTGTPSPTMLARPAPRRGRRCARPRCRARRGAGSPRDWRSSTSATPLPTVPKPSRPTRIGCRAIFGASSGRPQRSAPPGAGRSGAPVLAAVVCEERGRSGPSPPSGRRCSAGTRSAGGRGRGQLKPDALHDQHLLRLEQLEDELLVVVDRIQARIEPREQVERRLRLDAAHAREST